MKENSVQQELQPLETPVLFLIFNRPDLTEKVFGQIRKVRPRQLFIAADGPRATYPDDLEKCKKTRELVLGMINWDCEVKTLFRDKNLGCGLAVSQAITWFFEHVEMGIILEDDCYPDLSFFWFCQKLLEMYHNNSTVMHIGGVNFQNGKSRGKFSYYFSNYSHVWGWATWKRAWVKYNHNIQITDFDSNSLMKVLKDRPQAKFWNQLVINLSQDKIDTWDYRWHFAIFRYGGISIIPNKNMVVNLGFGSNATHTKNISIDQQVESITFPLSVPFQIEINYKADKYTFNKHYFARTSIKNHLRNLAYSIVPTKYYSKIKNYYVAISKSY